MVLVGDHLDVVPVVELVVELRVVARVLPVEVDAVQRQVLVDVVAVRGDLIRVPLVVVLVRGRHVSMLIGYPVLEGQIVEVLILMLDTSVVGCLIRWRRVSVLNDRRRMVGRSGVNHDAVLLLLVVHSLVRQWVLVVNVLVVVDRVMSVNSLVLADWLVMIDSFMMIGWCLVVDSGFMVVGRLLVIDSSLMVVSGLVTVNSLMTIRRFLMVDSLMTVDRL